MHLPEEPAGRPARPPPPSLPKPPLYTASRGAVPLPTATETLSSIKRATTACHLPFRAPVEPCRSQPAPSQSRAHRPAPTPVITTCRTTPCSSTASLPRPGHGHRATSASAAAARRSARCVRLRGGGVVVVGEQQEQGAGDLRLRRLHGGRGQQQLPAGQRRAAGQLPAQRRRLPDVEAHRKVQQRLQRRRLLGYEHGLQAQPAAIPRRGQQNQQAGLPGSPGSELCLSRIRHSRHDRELHHPVESAGRAVRRLAAQHHRAHHPGSRRRRAVAVGVPRQHRRQRPLRLLLAEQHAVGRRQEAVRRQPRLALPEPCQGPVRARREKVRGDRRAAHRVLPVPEEPAPARRLHRRPQRAGARVQQGRQGRHARPRHELPGAQVLRRELPRRGAEHHEAPAEARVQGRDERVLRVGAVQRQLRVHAQRDAVRQPARVPVLGPAAPDARRLQDRRRGHLRRLHPLRRAYKLQAAGGGPVLGKLDSRGASRVTV